MRGLLTALLSLILSASAAAQGPVYVAIIIDDMGNSLPLGREALALPGQLTYSVLPFRPHSRTLAIEAHARGKEIMLHEPMASISGKALGPGALVPSLSHDQFISVFESALASVPYVNGVNNHMGSYLTQQPMQMNWLMQDIKRHHLYFIDSRTTPKTVALKVAEEHQVFSSRRNVFLDDQLSFFYIDRQFRELIRTAKRDGTAIAIGHPHEITLQYLAIALPQLEAEGIHILPVSNLIAMQQITNLQYAKGD
ncbi:MAG TPA: divergent polysaccharide deacetylase family protein [Pseudomonadales bacterium]|nr:divergent polysaccharide deacetylase family protein [Pseudomonadales bacterium]